MKKREKSYDREQAETGVSDYGPLAEEFIRKYMDDTVDNTFGICFGDKIIKIQGDNIALGDEVYVGAPGLWALTTDRNPTEYTGEYYEGSK